MSAIFPHSLDFLSGSPKRPALGDVHRDEDCLADTVFIPGGVRCGCVSVSQWT
jgi:hypothetical protein